MKLHGENKLVHELFKHLRTFERDLQLYEQSLREHKVDHFPTLKSVFDAVMRYWIVTLEEWQCCVKNFPLNLKISEA